MKNQTITNNTTEGKNELDSNAKLIKFGPEMLDVLKLVNRYNWDCNQGRLYDEHKRIMRFAGVWDLVRDILEKLDEYETYPLEEEVA